REAQVEIPVHREEEKEVLEKTNQSMDQAARSDDLKRLRSSLDLNTRAAKEQICHKHLKRCKAGR
ncbi:hypothetical protein F2P79_026060, partial [Pimephales promelas]